MIGNLELEVDDESYIRISASIKKLLSIFSVIAILALIIFIVYV